MSRPVYLQEHLLIVCELLKANLYEFHKFNRESGGEVYFTMPRLQVCCIPFLPSLVVKFYPLRFFVFLKFGELFVQSITIQCLEALQFLHGLGLIHCDLKPENILVKSYSRCEVKVIDLGSSCFETDHLCSYVQSRSYRAPEVILGLPYDKKIDVWSLGCILAELCTGNVSEFEHLGLLWIPYFLYWLRKYEIMLHAYRYMFFQGVMTDVFFYISCDGRWK